MVGVLSSTDMLRTMITERTDAESALLLANGSRLWRVRNDKVTVPDKDSMLSIAHGGYFSFHTEFVRLSITPQVHSQYFFAIVIHNNLFSGHPTDCLLSPGVCGFSWASVSQGPSC